MKVIINGVRGRMGQNILTAAHQDLQAEIVGATETPGHSLIGKDVCQILGCSPLGVAVVDDLRSVIEKTDVVIDFTVSEATLSCLRLVREFHKKMVIGTTGFRAEQMDEIRSIAQEVPCVLAPNMGIGVNLLYRLAVEAAKVLGDDYEVEISEIHHDQKKDAPSGTALRLGELVSETLRRNLAEVGVYGRHGITGVRNPQEIGIHAIRGGDVVGEHTVYFIGNGDRIELTHRAHNRMHFARGAIRAAKFLMRAPAGELYDMQDVLGLKENE